MANDLVMLGTRSIKAEGQQTMNHIGKSNYLNAPLLKYAVDDPIWKLTVSIKEASQLSGLGRSTIYEAMVSGKLKAKKSGKRTIILIGELNDFLAALPSATFASPTK
jgi:excisionase family DNA binding protein